MQVVGFAAKSALQYLLVNITYNLEHVAGAWRDGQKGGMFCGCADFATLVATLGLSQYHHQQ